MQLFTRCVAHGSRTTPTAGPRHSRAKLANSLSLKRTQMLCPRAHAQSMAWTERISRCQGEYNAREAPAASPISSCRSTAANRQHLWRREASSAAAYLMHGDGVVPHEDGICLLRSHLHAKHKQQLEILAVLSRRVPPLWQSVRAGVQGWVLEQGKCSRSWGQQLMVHADALRTVD